jgi:hypothetical protein
MSLARNLGLDARAVVVRAVDAQAAVERLDAVGEAAQPRAAGRICTANAVVGDRDARGMARQRTLTVALSAWACLAMFVIVSARRSRPPPRRAPAGARPGGR